MIREPQTRAAGLVLYPFSEYQGSGGLHTPSVRRWRMRQTNYHLLYNIEKNYQLFSFVTHLTTAKSDE